MASVLPAFLRQGSPPRSPHVEHHGFFSALAPVPQPYAHHQGPGGPSRVSHYALRPTRRDVLLCLVTLSFAYLLFSPAPNAQIPSRPAATSGRSASGKYRLSGLGDLLYGPSHPEDGESCAVSPIGREQTFGESVRPVGFGTLSDEFKPALGDGRPWDEGEEQAEDDELEGMATVLRGYAPGWTLFDKLYIYNGSFYVVTDEKQDWPELRLMTSTGLPADNKPGNSEAREPKGDEIMYITPFDAMKLWGPRVYRMEGMSFLFNDGQFIDHYYHFAAELLLGAWRAYSSLDSGITPQGETSLPPPKRIWFLHQNTQEWRDTPRFNPTIVYSTFPSVSILYPDDWADLTNQTISGEPKAFLLDRALLADRSASFRGEWTGPTARTVASALHVGSVSRWWWEPIRRQVLRYSGVSEAVLDRNLEGYGALDPVRVKVPGTSTNEPLSPPGDYTPVITYISRQNSRRRLTKESHEDLVKALEERAKKLGWELIVVEAERMSKEEQFALAGRTTIMLGVHGNGLTHLLWMPPTPRSAVIEMFYPGGFARDYQWTAHALGIRHFAVQHDSTFTAPNLPPVAYPEGFQGTSITVVGKVVADLIEDRLAGRA